MHVLTEIGFTIDPPKGTWLDWLFFKKQKTNQKKNKQQQPSDLASLTDQCMFCTWSSNAESSEFKKSFLIN